MKHTKPTVLLVDDCRFTRRAIFNAIEAAMPECKIICVPSLMAAQAAGAEMEIDLFIVDTVLPDGSGIDFLADMVMVQDHAAAILLADEAVPTHVKNSSWFQNIHILRKAVDRARLLRLMREILGDRGGISSGSSHEVTPLWRTRLEEESAEEIIHRKTDLMATTILEFVGHGEAGVVYFLNGRLTYAETGDAMGDEAIRKILSWRRGYAFELPPLPVRKAKCAPGVREPETEPASEVDRTTELDNVANVVADDLDGASALRASSSC